MIIAKDSKGLGPSKNPDPDLIKGDSTSFKRIIFIRHGESDWNDVFNKGFGPNFFVRLFGALFREFLCFASFDSVFIDSPLNFDGIKQAKELREFIDKDKLSFSDKDEILTVMNGDSKESSVIVSSNLRRAISTTTLALWPRIHRTKEKIFVLNSLQEISRNIDTQALSDSNNLPDLSRITHELSDEGYHFNPVEVFDMTGNSGNKTLNFYGIKRLQAFNAWVFSRPESTFIVGGHSLWFKSFFQTYLPHKSDLPCKSKKIANSGVVSFSLHKADKLNSNGEPAYRIDPESVRTVYLGLEVKK